MLAQSADHTLLGRELVFRPLGAGDIVAVIAGKHVENARTVMAAHQIHQRIEERLGIIMR